MSFVAGLVAGFVRGWTWSFFIFNPRPFSVNADHCVFSSFSNVWRRRTRIGVSLISMVSVVAWGKPQASDVRRLALQDSRECSVGSIHYIHAPHPYCYIVLPTMQNTSDVFASTYRLLCIIRSFYEYIKLSSFAAYIAKFKLLHINIMESLTAALISLTRS